MSGHKQKGNSSKNLALLVFIPIFVGLFFIIKYSLGTNSNPKAVASADSVVSETDGIQYINITAKGGYTPSNITAKANLKTVLRVKTAYTFDCSSALVIPSLNYRANLPQTGITEINIEPQTPNSEILGTCAMGMYRFSIKFL